MPVPVPHLSKEPPLRTISASKLWNRDPSIEDELLSAAEELGFFYLDYRGTILEEVGDLYRVAQDFFRLSLSEKLEYDVETQGPEKYNGCEDGYSCTVLVSPVY